MHEQILAGFESGSGSAPRKPAFFGLTNLVLLVAAIVLIVVLVRWALS